MTKEALDIDDPIDLEFVDILWKKMGNNIVSTVLIFGWLASWKKIY